MMNELALFAGAGGGILGAHLLGWRTVCAVEIDPYCRRVLMQRQNDGVLDPFPIWDDVRTFDGTAWRGRVDVVTAGFPCQPFSSAARGRNVAECLWNEAGRIITESGPRYVLLENVVNAEARLVEAAASLEQWGYQVDGGAVVAAASVGAPQIRRRRWLLGYTDGDCEPTVAVDDEVAGVSGDARVVWWNADPGILGMAHGLPHRVDRLRALGNGQVPAVVRRAWELLAP